MTINSKVTAILSMMVLTLTGLAIAADTDNNLLKNNGSLARLFKQAGVYNTSSTGKTPGFVVDPAWPQPLPNNWRLGQIGGLYVDPAMVPGRSDRVGGIGICQHHEVADDRRHEHKRPGRKEERGRLAVCARKGHGVERSDPAPDLAAASVDDPMTTRNEPVEVTVDGFVGPVSLRSSEVGGGAPVKSGKREHLRRRQAVEASAARSREQVLEPVPVIPPQRNEIFCSHSGHRPKLPDAAGAGPRPRRRHA